MCCALLCVSEWVGFDVFAKKKPKHFVRYFYSSALPVQLNMYNVTVSLFFCWQTAWWLSWIARAAPLQLLKVGCWRDWSCYFFVLFIIDCTNKMCFVEMHDIGCRIWRRLYRELKKFSLWRNLFCFITMKHVLMCERIFFFFFFLTPYFQTVFSGHRCVRWHAGVKHVQSFP